MHADFVLAMCSELSQHLSLNSDILTYSTSAVKAGPTSIAHILRGDAATMAASRRHAIVLRHDGAIRTPE